MIEEYSEPVLDNDAEQPIAPPTVVAVAPNPPALLKSRPVQQAERDVAIDVLRGVALLGILVMNIRSFASGFLTYGNPTFFADETGIHTTVWLVGHVLFDMKMMSIFSMLFGAGIVLMASRLKAKGQGTAGVHYRRMGWMLLIGLCHAHLIWHGDILVMYSLMGMLAYLAWQWKIRFQIGIGLLLILIGSGLMLLIGWSMGLMPEEAYLNMKEGMVSTPEKLAEEIETFRGSWLEQMPTRVIFSLFMETILIFLFGIWRVLGLMLLGMGLYRLGLFSAKRSNKFYGAMLLLGAGIGVPLIFYGYQLNSDGGFGTPASKFLYGQFNYIGSMFVAMAWIGAIMLFIKSGFMKWMTKALTAVGQMAFTNYLMQSIICTLIFYGHGLGLIGEYQYFEQLYFVLAIWCAELIWSPIWLTYFRFGPFEWLWRSLTYWKFQPLKR